MCKIHLACLNILHVDHIVIWCHLLRGSLGSGLTAPSVHVDDGTLEDLLEGIRSIHGAGVILGSFMISRPGNVQWALSVLGAAQGLPVVGHKRLAAGVISSCTVSAMAQSPCLPDMQRTSFTYQTISVPLFNTPASKVKVAEVGEYYPLIASEPSLEIMAALLSSRAARHLKLEFDDSPTTPDTRHTAPRANQLFEAPHQDQSNNEKSRK
ncbi:hypothetical protein T440DRAFT_479785 [Plenodomus tracheiphilus IPT5]|uniref:Uncharacterized protein n=1 Tax=Plenodomus tracheiphilus IPT5 TaxID=1408161 RepID=A0A6A7B6K5_9PLEO|nr:hypothetical protein T440DRAFT_479785 [Plenodomus tracheiphilus IPT5]